MNDDEILKKLHREGSDITPSQLSTYMKTHRKKLQTGEALLSSPRSTPTAVSSSRKRKQHDENPNVPNRKFKWNLGDNYFKDITKAQLADPKYIAKLMDNDKVCPIYKQQKLMLSPGYIKLQMEESLLSQPLTGTKSSSKQHPTSTSNRILDIVPRTLMHKEVMMNSSCSNLNNGVSRNHAYVEQENVKNITIVNSSTGKNEGVKLVDEPN